MTISKHTAFTDQCHSYKQRVIWLRTVLQAVPRLPHPRDDDNGLRVKQLIDSIKNPTAQPMVPQLTYVVRLLLAASSIATCPSQRTPPVQYFDSCATVGRRFCSCRM